MNITDNLIPLSKVVKASIVDTYGDYGAKYELHTHWGARYLRELLNQYTKLKTKLTGRRILLKVNANTHTATLPCDFESARFVGGICNGKKVALKKDGRLINNSTIEIEADKVCDKCGQDTSICNDLAITETTETVTINDTDYLITTVKKLYPNGDYYLETTTPFISQNLVHTSETLATATITITDIGVEGEVFEVLVNDPVAGNISLGTYTQEAGDIYTDILAGNITGALQANAYNYIVSNDGEVITITAAAGLGDSINDDDDERLTFTSTYITAEVTQFTGGVDAIDLPDDTVEYNTTKEFITNLDLQECGCLAVTPENLCTLQTYCPDTFYCHYAACDTSCNTDYGGYNILEDVGLIQLDFNYPSTQLYLEYNGFLNKINGQYYVPAIAFETLVEAIKFMAVDGKASVSNPDKAWRLNRLVTVKSNMSKVLYRFPLRSVYDAATSTPKIDINYDSWYSCYRRNCDLVAAAATVTDTCASEPAVAPTTSTVIYVTKEDVYGKIQFTVGESGSPMVLGNSVYTLLETNNTNVRNVREGSVNVVVDGVSLSEDLTDQLSYTVEYTAGATTVTFLNVPAGLVDEQKVKITYVKAV